MASEMGRIVRSGFWLYLCSLTNNVFGFFYWLLISKIGGPRILGFVSATIGLASLVTSLFSMGIPIGVQRFLGMHMRNREELTKFFWSSTLLLLASEFCAGTMLAIIALMGRCVGNYTPAMMIFASVFVSLSSLSLSLQALLVSILRTSVLAIATLIGNLAKLCLGVSLVYAGFGWIGAALGYLAIPLAIAITGSVEARRFVSLKPCFDRYHATESLRAGLASWIPNAILILGQQLAVVTVFGTHGAFETGRFYLAYTIAGFVGAVATSMLMLLLPVLSSMEQGREALCKHAIRLCLAVVTPIAIILATYPELPLSLLGASYVEAAPSLSILALAILALVPTTAITNLFYSYGDYRKVALAGLCSSLPRVVLYATLVPSYGGIGAAIAYTVGAYTPLPYLITIARGRIRIETRKLFATLAIPIAIAVTIRAVDAPWLLGVPLIAASYLAYTRLRIVSRNDVKILLSAFLSSKTLNAVYRRAKPLIDLVVPP